MGYTLCIYFLFHTKISSLTVQMNESYQADIDQLKEAQEEFRSGVTNLNTIVTKGG